MGKIVSIVSILLVALAAGFIYLVGFKLPMQTPTELESPLESSEEKK